MDFSEFQLDQLTKLSATSTGILVGTIFLLLLLCTAVVRPARWWSLTMLIYAVTMGVPDLFHPMISPIQEIAEFTRPICGALLVALIVPTIRSNRGWRMQSTNRGIFFYFAFELALSIRMFAHGMFARAYFGTISFVLVFLVLNVGLGRWLQSLKDAFSALRCVAWAGVLIIVGTLIQFSVDPNTVIWGGRLHGTTINANFLGTLLATTILPTAFLATRSHAKFLARAFYVAIITLSGVMIVWSGSRTAALMAFCGVVIFSADAWHFLLVGAITCALGMMVWNYYSPEESAGRMLDVTSDTRSVVWKAMFDQFLTSPVYGYSGQETGGSENSYLLTARSTGIIGLLPLLVGLVLIVKSVRTVARRVPRRGTYRDLADLAAAGIFSLLIGGLFEGYLCAFYSVPVIALYVYCALISFLQDSATAAEQPGLGFPSPLDAEMLAYPGPSALDPQLALPSY